MLYKTLGINGPRVSALGLGCMGMSANYELEHDDGESVALMQSAYNAGINFFDIADIYGYGHNEELLGRALKENLVIDREHVVIATKCGFTSTKDMSLNFTPEYIHKACGNSLKRLGITYIDLYYLHRVPPTLIELEQSLGALADLLQNGLVHYVGLCEASPESIRFAHAYFKKMDLSNKFVAIQSEFSLLTQNVLHNGVLSTCKELGLGFVPYSPLSRALLTSSKKMHAEFKFDNGDFRGILPRFQGENFKINLNIRDELDKLAQQKGCTVPQLSLSYLMAQEDFIVPIPGTRKLKNLMDNIGSLSVKLTSDDLQQIASIVEGRVQGTRYAPEMFARQNIRA